MKKLLALLCLTALCAGAGAGVAVTETTLVTETTVTPAATVTPAVTEATAVPAETAVPGELSGLYGQDIAQAAAQIGGMTHWAGDEYADNYESDALALRGNGGLVGDIELKDAPGGYALCGVSVGMSRAEVEALMAACPVLWTYDEELAFTVREDGENELKNEILVVFFSEDGRVSGAWYRASGIE